MKNWACHIISSLYFSVRHIIFQVYQLVIRNHLNFQANLFHTVLLSEVHSLIWTYFGLKREGGKQEWDRGLGGKEGERNGGVFLQQEAEISVYFCIWCCDTRVIHYSNLGYLQQCYTEWDTCQRDKQGWPRQIWTSLTATTVGADFMFGYATSSVLRQ